MKNNILRISTLYLILLIIFSIVVVSGVSQANITSLKIDHVSYPNPGGTISINSKIESNYPEKGNFHIDYSITTQNSDKLLITHISYFSLENNQSYTDLWSLTNTEFLKNGQCTLKADLRQGNGDFGSGDLLDSKTTTLYSISSPESIVTAPSIWSMVAIALFLILFTTVSRIKRWWLSFYLTGSLALLLLLISFFILTGYDIYLMGIEAKNMAYVASSLGITSNYIPPNAFIFPDPSGWSIFGIGFESSSIIEISVLIGLLSFYPGYKLRKKLKYIILGILVIYFANIVRMMSIVYIINIFGQSYVYLANAIIGKMIFFVFIVILFWYLLTKPTLKIVRDNIKS